LRRVDDLYFNNMSFLKSNEELSRWKAFLFLYILNKKNIIFDTLEYAMHA